MTFLWKATHNKGESMRCKKKNMFMKYACEHKNLLFYVTRIGCGIAGFTDAEIAPLFMKARSLNNVRIPESFDLILNEMI